MTRLDHRLHFNRMRAVHHLKYVIPIHEPESRVCALQVVDGLSHVTFGGEHQRRDAVFGEFDLLGLAYLLEALDNLTISEAGVAKDSTARLEGLDDFVGLIAGEGEAGG